MSKRQVHLVSLLPFSLLFLDIYSAQGRLPLLGDALALVGAFSYGAYTTYLAKRIPNEKIVSMPMFFGISLFFIPFF